MPTLPEEDTNDKEVVGRGGRKRRNAVQPFVRRLNFDNAPLVVAPPDVIPEEEIYCQSTVNGQGGQGCKEDILVTDGQEVYTCICV